MNKMQRPDYFDIETEGLSIDSPVFHANLNGKLLNRDTERRLLIQIVAWLWEHEHGPPVMGKNLIFDLKHIQARCEVLKVQAHLVRWQYVVKHLDLKEIAVMLNDGFKGYQRWIDRADKPPGSEIPEWYKQNDWPRIEQYSENERIDTVKFYDWMLQILGRVALEDRPY
jgi:hypothetical protein